MIGLQIRPFFYEKKTRIWIWTDSGFIKIFITRKILGFGIYKDWILNIRNRIIFGDKFLIRFWSNFWWDFDEILVQPFWTNFWSIFESKFWTIFWTNFWTTFLIIFWIFFLRIFSRKVQDRSKICLFFFMCVFSFFFVSLKQIQKKKLCKRKNKSSKNKSLQNFLFLFSSSFLLFQFSLIFLFSFSLIKE